MITLITGVPGSGKSLYTVAELLKPLQSATFEHEGSTVKRVLYTNIKNLLLDHIYLDKDDLLKWPTWCKPGDVICYDEVQEVWRPRGVGAGTPDSIAKLETHRHMGVDFVLITQHPNLLDQNIRRLVGRHLHVRRIANMALSVVYEWDHASNPGMVKTAITTRPWRYPKWAYKLYKSAEAHTKQPRKLPFALLVLLIAAAGLAYGTTVVSSRMTERFSGTVKQDVTNKPVALTSPASVIPLSVQNVPIIANVAPVASSPLVVSGCISVRERCECYTSSGYRMPMTIELCRGSFVAGSISASTIDTSYRSVDADARSRELLRQDVEVLQSTRRSARSPEVAL